MKLGKVKIAVMFAPLFLALILIAAMANIPHPAPEWSAPEPIAITVAGVQSGELTAVSGQSVEFSTTVTVPFRVAYSVSGVDGTLKIDGEQVQKDGVLEGGRHTLHFRFTAPDVADVERNVRILSLTFNTSSISAYTITGTFYSSGIAFLARGIAIGSVAVFLLGVFSVFLVWYGSKILSKEVTDEIEKKQNEIETLQKRCEDIKGEEERFFLCTEKYIKSTGSELSFSEFLKRELSANNITTSDANNAESEVHQERGNTKISDADTCLVSDENAPSFEKIKKILGGDNAKK